MLKANADHDWLPLYTALASDARLAIIRLLAESAMNIKELAAHLRLSSAIVTMHVRKLETAGIIKSAMVRKDKGTHKVCSLALDGVEIVFPHRGAPEKKFHEVSVPVGHFTDFDIYPTCGLATRTHIIGQYDDPRYFLEPERVDAGILWLGKGYVEYKIPNYLLPGERLLEIEVSMEISSEAPGVNENWPSDIRFRINDVDVGMWTSPGDFGKLHGRFTPRWWSDAVNQYGLLKVLKVNREGTFMDGQRISDITIDGIVDRRNHWLLRLSVEEDAEHVGGLTLFGEGFGNYNQNIRFRVYYETREMRHG